MPPSRLKNEASFFCVMTWEEAHMIILIGKCKLQNGDLQKELYI